ncbi:GNAT family N-acetyltransferase [Clostridium cibarium]|uniref:GNAT family N-acetyltransferase n=1 Tax=Clostridium cibarium TaxID=2762247 RepID=A0ABR8PYH0_9CLOT|nr:GNAT family N-acetyltransferase [Clostridium cibarium]MBD7913219.1 GNAT family N-acetyltransferase [Clostridium cibarium]
MKIIHSKDVIRSFLKNNDKDNYMYLCCNLEDEFWDCTQMFGLYDKEKIVAIAFLSFKYGFPILVGSSYCDEDENMNLLIKTLDKFLPKDLYCHLNPKSVKYLCDSREVTSSVIFYNMKLNKRKTNLSNTIDNVVRIEYSEKNKLIKFLEASNPGYMMEEKYLKEGYYYGIFHNDEIISAAGVFSYGTEFGVLQIGNVATAPAYRNKGLAKKVISRLIKSIDLNETDIVLNVISHNYNALKLYKNLGFEVIGTFEENQLV